MKRWTKEDVILEILLMDEEGKDLSISGVRKYNQRLEKAAKRLFGSWKNAITEAGLDYDEVKRWKKPDLVEIDIDGYKLEGKKCLGCGFIKPLSHFVSKDDIKCWKCLEKKEPIEITYVEVEGELIPAKRCSKCGVVKTLDSFNKGVGLGGVRADCKECKSKQRRSWYEANRERELKYQAEYRRKNPEIVKDRMREWQKKNPEKMKAIYHKRLARKKGLLDTLTNEEWNKVLHDFEGKCALLGTDSNLCMEHFIPLSIHHGGTYVGNVYPMDRSLNCSKWSHNPFEWIKRPDVREKVSIERWNALVEYLAEQNGLTVDEFKDFVYWCFDNPRSLKQAAKDTARGITSLDLWRDSRSNRDLAIFTKEETL